MKQLLHAGRRMLTKKFNPAGFNIGVNVGEAGGQTVMHCHFHLIPRYIGGDDPIQLAGFVNYYQQITRRTVKLLD